MRHQRGRLMMTLAVVGIAAMLSSCTYADMVHLAGDDTQGRDNGTPGSLLAQQYLISQLKPIAQGANTALTGDAAYTQPINGGTNIIAVIPGTDLANQYVMVDAHYDHLGSNCRTAVPTDTICNGATDNAAGVTAALAIGRSIATASTRPRRSVILAFWDREEDGLLGSAFYTAHPLVPLASTVAAINFDIFGANLSPSLRNTTFALGAETGGSAFTNIVRAAADDHSLDTAMLSTIFGEGRSDHVSLLAAHIPTIFFTDATGPCYHTAQDEIGVVDFTKLDKEIGLATEVAQSLVATNTPPAYAAGTLLATFDDAVALARINERYWNDRDRLSTSDRATVAKALADVEKIVSDGRANFDSADVNTMLSDALAEVNVLTHGACDGFLAPSK